MLLVLTVQIKIENQKLSLRLISMKNRSS